MCPINVTLKSNKAQPSQLCGPPESPSAPGNFTSRLHVMLATLHQLFKARDVTVGAIGLATHARQCGLQRRRYQDSRPEPGPGTWAALSVGILGLLIILGFSAWAWRKINKEAESIADTEAARGS